MLEKLTKKQEALMITVRDEWINLSLHKGPKIDKEECESGVKWLYYISNLKEPKVVIVKSPTDFSKIFRDSVRASVGASVGASVVDLVRDSVGASVLASVGASVRASVWASVRASVGDSVWASVRASVLASVRASVGDSVGDSVWASVSYCSLVGDSDWGTWYEYYKKIGVINDEKANKYIGFIKSGAFYCMFFEKVAYVMQRPEWVLQDGRKRLHSMNKPAIQWSDKTKEYYLEGIKFDENLWKKISKDKLTAEEVFAIENTEQRRVAYQKMDKLKMKELKNYKVEDEVKDDGYGFPMKVISFKMKNFDSPFYFLNCFCPSTKREYFIETRETDCWKAKQKSFGLDVKFDEEF